MQKITSLKTILVVFLFVFSLSSCKEAQSENENTDTTETTIETDTTTESSLNLDEMRHDSHSYAQAEEAIAKHLDLDIEVDFESKSLKGTASWKIENKKQVSKIYFDINNLEITKVMLGDTETTFQIGDEEEFLGQSLEIDITPETQNITIHYSTKPESEALQWLNPQQTAGKKSPFLFTQSQAILVRSWIPSQDSPGVRITYNAKVKVPSDLMAVMSASNATQKNDTGVYEFEMKQAIPAYLIALSVGDLEFQALGDNSGVYAEPSVIKKAAYEFEQIPAMIKAAENLYGAYRWERYDVIVLPPSFPFGGMENPRLTFATPTILAGDRSLVALIAHELAHSWSGNLVTNATWDDFWLNEGFTVYFENRIMEAVNGEDYANMLAIISYQDLAGDIASLDPEDTHLKLDLKGRNPDDGMTSIAYDKGFYLLKTIETTVGREKFDTFLKGYFEHFAFKTIITEEFVTYLNQNLISQVDGAAEKIQLNKWIYEAGLPENCPKITSSRYDQAFEMAAKWKEGTAAKKLETKDWTYQQWVFFLGAIPETLTEKQMRELDTAFGFTKSGNSEILGKWFVLASLNEYKAAYPAMEAFLIQVGRRKFLSPIYTALSKKENSLAWAKQVYQKARPNYHSVSFNSIDKILGE
jgi:leukotriene A-4 hydrolase/aminopeptidase